MSKPQAALEERLLNDWQAGLPLHRSPFAAIARSLEVTEAAVVAALARLVAQGKVSRVGAVFRPGAIGASTLAALAIPEHDLARVAAGVAARPEVNHAYEREHRYNLWFVATAADERALAAAVAEIGAAAGQQPISLPLVTDYWIDLAFGLGDDLARDRSAARRLESRPRPQQPVTLREVDRQVVSALEDGLPLVSHPYAEIAARAGTSEVYVQVRLADWLNQGVIRRLGVVVRHRALGYVANAMVVWNVPDADVDGVGASLARERGVTLCYRRHRDEARWPYNLYCMVHGRNRAVVEAHVARLASAHDLDRSPGAVLFSRQAYKQRGAHYGLTTPAGVAAATA